MLDTPLVFVDLETTGGSFDRDRIIEIGIIRVEAGQPVAHYSQLLNPHTHLPPFISTLTGITPAELESAPTFAQIKSEVSTLLKDALFIAHNARFDYGFIKSEFKREEITFSSKTLCTARLSRRLYPQFRHHKLDDLISRHDLTITHRHRAYDDAHVLWQFYQEIEKAFDPATLKPVYKELLAQPSIPTHIDPQLIKSLPESSGVYRFFNQENAPLYVGKSQNIRHRVRSHLTATSTSSKAYRLASQTYDIDSLPTAGNLGAELLESHLIKTMQPIFNRQLRRTRTLVSLTYTENPDGYLVFSINQDPHLDFDSISSSLAIFRSRKQAKDVLRTITTDYQLCPKLNDLESDTSSCFSYHLGDCLGACLQKESPLRYNLRVVKAFTHLHLLPWPFSHPIQITESRHDHTDHHYFYNWCYLGTLSNLTSAYPSRHHDFDLDQYKLLVRYLKKNQHAPNITSLPTLPELSNT